MRQASNYKKFLLLWSGELISAIGSGLTSFGLSVYVFQKTESAGSMALVALLAFLPTLLLSPVAGVLSDRYDRRLLMMAGDGLSAAGLLYILVCMLRGGASVIQICIGVFISAVFSSLLEPAYRATLTEMLTREEYSRASGMVSIAGSARYLISPMLAGFLLTVSDVRLLLIIDIGTLLLTVICTAIVRSTVSSCQAKENAPFAKSFREGWQAITQNRGVCILIMVSSFMTCFMGTMQILSEPMILAFSNSKMLGMTETICACGMLVSGVIIGILGLKKNYVRTLCLSLAASGLAMVGFGSVENIIVICCFGFLFFSMLPFANNCLDYLIRINIDATLQGRAWGLIGFLSQIGYVVAYGSAGFVADKVAAVNRIGVGRGAASVVMVSGAMLTVAAITLLGVKEIHALEGGVSQC